MIIVIGSILGAADRIEELFALGQAHVARSRLEPGCIAHAVYRDPENLLRLVFVEEWADEAALKTHFAVEASRDFVRAAASMSTARPEIRIYSATQAGFP